MAAQWMEAIEDALPNLNDHIADGHFAPLLDWLRTHIHQHGRKYTAPQLLERATGAELSAEAWLRYAQEKFGTLYDL
jgi:carboxypeptidase Taq